MNEEAPVKRWTATRKTAVMMDIFRCKTTVAELARQHDLTVSDVESWMDEGEPPIPRRLMTTLSELKCCACPVNSRIKRR